MASTISAGTSTGTALNLTGDTSGALALQTNNGTTAITIDTSQNVGIGAVPSAWAGSGIQLQLKTNLSLRADGSTGQVVNNAYYDGGSWRYLATGRALLQEFGSGANANTTWYSSASGTAGGVITFSPILTLNNAGNLVLSGGTTSANGVGITFPATQSASSDANTLDDYEEGTWTPTFTGSSGAPSSVSYTTQTARYTKIGRVVYVEAYIAFNAYSGGSGNVLISGLPFTAAAGGPYSGFLVQENTGFSITGSYYSMILQVGGSGSSMSLLKLAPNLASTAVSLGQVATSGTVYLLFSGCYTVA